MSTFSRSSGAVSSSPLPPKPRCCIFEGQEIGMQKDQIILDLCGGTGAWSRPYAEAGYDVRNITLPDYDVRKFNFDGPPNVYGILAAPPCEQFSIASGKKYHERDLSFGMDIVKACLEIIWAAQYQRRLKFWCLENPVGLLRQFLGVPKVTVKYWWYGDDRKKPTDLWGNFEAPRRKFWKMPFWVIDNIKHAPFKKSFTEQFVWRATTPPGFAKAFFEANP